LTRNREEMKRDEEAGVSTSGQSIGPATVSTKKSALHPAFYVG